MFSLLSCQAGEGNARGFGKPLLSDLALNCTLQAGFVKAGGHIRLFLFVFLLSSFRNRGSHLCTEEISFVALAVAAAESCRYRGGREY